ncbi:hypothetical protein ACQ4PT_022890 [Festuca glaucescens]
MSARDLHLRLSQTQRVRLEAALHELQTLAPAATAAVNVAGNIPVNHEDSILIGHGTSDWDGEVVATLCGVVERVQKHVCVRTLRARYKPELGDIIVGRVTELDALVELVRSTKVSSVGIDTLGRIVECSSKARKEFVQKELRKTWMICAATTGGFFVECLTRSRKMKKRALGGSL